MAVTTLQLWSPGAAHAEALMGVTDVTAPDDRVQTPARDEARVPCYTDPVANLTLVIDDDTLRRARIRALEEGTSVNAVVRDYLERFADADERAMAGRRRVLEIARSRTAGTAGVGRAWTRDELYEERTRWPRS